MFSPPPKLNITAICSNNCDKLINFYSDIGMLFNSELKDNGKKYYSYIYNDLRFEIHEVDTLEEVTRNLKLRFLIDEIEGYLVDFAKHNIKIIKEPWATKTHQHILLNDPDGNLIELITEL